jgi:hypothetical protein
MAALLVAVVLIAEVVHGTLHVINNFTIEVTDTSYQP